LEEGAKDIQIRGAWSYKIHKAPQETNGYHDLVISTGKFGKYLKQGLVPLFSLYLYQMGWDKGKEMA
jgi:hypothetical protein